MAPILVVGEQEEGEPAERAVAAQLDAWLADLPADADVLVAYEPAWAIGRPQPAPPGHVADATLAVRGLLAAASAIPGSSTAAVPSPARSARSATPPASPPPCRTGCSWPGSASTRRTS